MAEKSKRFLAFLALAIFVAVLPLGQEPHLIQKMKLLLNGWLNGLADWGDLFFHGLPLAGALAYGFYLMVQRHSEKVP